jgi:hypothetical protein
MTSNSPQDPQDPIALPLDTNADATPIREPLNLFQDEAQWREAIRIEEEYGGDIGAGRDWGAQLGAFLQDPAGMESLAQLRDWMLKEFRLMLIEWDLGVTVDAINAIARPLLIQRFRQPSIALQDQLWHLFEQARVVRTDASDAAAAAAHQACIEVRRIMVQTLTEEDWQALRQSAISMLEQYLHHRQAEVNGNVLETEHDAAAEG